MVEVLHEVIIDMHIGMADKALNISSETFIKWSRIREEQGLPSDDIAVCCLLTLHVNHESLYLPDQSPRTILFIDCISLKMTTLYLPYMVSQ